MKSWNRPGVLPSLLLALLPALAHARQTEVQTELLVIPAPPPPVNGSEVNHNFWVGGAVALSRDWAFVSDYTTADATGEVYVYRRTSTGWVSHQKLQGDLRSGFGAALSVEGMTLVVGAFIWNDLAGRVYVFGLREGMWILQQDLFAPGVPDSEKAHFGFSVAIEGDVLAIGALGVDHPVEFGGAVFVYERTGGPFELVARFHLPLIQEVLDGDLSRLGRSVALDGNRLAAGAHVLYGAVFLYERKQAGWGLESFILNPTSDSGDNFGNSVDLEGDFLVIGEPARNDVHNAPGRAYVYERAGEGQWSLNKTLRPSDGFGGGDTSDEFGTVVAIEGKHILVGAPYADYNGFHTGTLYWYEHEPTGWPAFETRRLAASDSSGTSDRLGTSLALRDGMILSGAPGGWVDGVSEGKAYVFAIELGQAYCDPSDQGGSLRITGSATAEQRNLTLVLQGLPARARGLFLLAPTRGASSFESSALCLGGSISRLGLATAGFDGLAFHPLDFQESWIGGKLLAGSTWYFQCVHEGQVGSGKLEEHSNAVSLTLE